MIHLDANFLIAGVNRASPEARAIEKWLQGGETLACSTISWCEFLNGPVLPAQIATAREFLTAGCADFETLLASCVELGVEFMACEMGLRAIGLARASLRPDAPIAEGGLATLLMLDAEIVVL